MSGGSRRKGARGELEVAKVFRAHGFTCDRTPNSGGLMIPGDLIGNVPLHVEVKRAERLKVPEWWAQAVAEADGRTPLLAFRQNSGEWLALMRLEDLAAIL